MEVTGRDTCQRTKRSMKKYGKLPAKIKEETPRDKIFVYIIGPYKIRRKGKQPQILKYVTMIYPVTGWFGITQYSNKKEIPITNLVETTWMFSYLWPVEIMYNRGGEFLGHRFKYSLIEKECRIKTRPNPPGNPQANGTMEIINQVIGNLV